MPATPTRRPVRPPPHSRAGSSAAGRIRNVATDRIEPLAAAALVCLVLSTVVWVPGGLVRFVLPKLLLAAIGIGLSLWARPCGRLPRSVICTLGSAFLVLGVAALLGAEPLSQLVGRWPRYEGLIALPVYLGAAWAGARLLHRDAPDGHWRTVVRTSSIAATLLGVVAVLEAFGIEPLGGTAERLGGLSGNATDEGVCALVLAMVLVIPALHRAADWWTRIGLTGALLAVILSGSRGAMLGLAIAAGVLASAGWVRRRRRADAPARNTLAPWWVPAIIIVACAGLALLVPAVGSRLLPGDATAAATVTGRQLLWSESLALWRENPLLGVGPSGFVDGITAQHTQEWAAQIGPANPPDSPHSWPLQALLAGGPLLFLLAGVLAGQVIWLGWRAFSTADQRSGRHATANAITNGGALAAVIGFGIALLTHFTGASTTVLAALLGGALVSRAIGQDATGNRRGPADGRGTLIARWIATVMVAFFGGLLLTASAAEWPMQRAMDAIQAGRPDDADAAFQYAEQLRPWDADISLLAATALSRAAMENPSATDDRSQDTARLADLSATWAARAEQRLPGSAEALFALASAQEAVGTLTDALATYVRLQSLSPTNALVWQRQGVVQAQLGDHLGAEASLLQAASLSPDSPEPWQNLAMLYGLMNRPDDQVGAQLRADDLTN